MSENKQPTDSAADKEQLPVSGADKSGSSLLAWSPLYALCVLYLLCTVNFGVAGHVNSAMDGLGGLTSLLYLMVGAVLFLLMLLCLNPFRNRSKPLRVLFLLCWLSTLWASLYYLVLYPQGTTYMLGSRQVFPPEYGAFYALNLQAAFFLTLFLYQTGKRLFLQLWTATAVSTAIFFVYSLTSVYLDFYGTSFSARADIPVQLFSLPALLLFLFLGAAVPWCCYALSKGLIDYLSSVSWLNIRGVDFIAGYTLVALIAYLGLNFPDHQYYHFSFYYSPQRFLGGLLYPAVLTLILYGAQPVFKALCRGVWFVLRQGVLRPLEAVYARLSKWSATPRHRVLLYVMGVVLALAALIGGGIFYYLQPPYRNALVFTQTLPALADKSSVIWEPQFYQMKPERLKRVLERASAEVNEDLGAYKFRGLTLSATLIPCVCPDYLHDHYRRFGYKEGQLFCELHKTRHQGEWQLSFDHMPRYRLEVDFLEVADPKVEDELLNTLHGRYGDFYRYDAWQRMFVAVQPRLLTPEGRSVPLLWQSPEGAEQRRVNLYELSDIAAVALPYIHFMQDKLQESFYAPLDDRLFPGHEEQLNRQGKDLSALVFGLTINAIVLRPERDLMELDTEVTLFPDVDKQLKWTDFIEKVKAGGEIEILKQWRQRFSVPVLNKTYNFSYGRFETADNKDFYIDVHPGRYGRRDYDAADPYKQGHMNVEYYDAEIYDSVRKKYGLEPSASLPGMRLSQ